MLLENRADLWPKHAGGETQRSPGSYPGPISQPQLRLFPLTALWKNRTRTCGGSLFSVTAHLKHSRWSEDSQNHRQESKQRETVLLSEWFLLVRFHLCRKCQQSEAPRAVLPSLRYFFISSCFHYNKEEGESRGERRLRRKPNRAVFPSGLITHSANNILMVSWQSGRSLFRGCYWRLKTTKVNSLCSTFWDSSTQNLHVRLGLLIDLCRRAREDAAWHLCSGIDWWFLSRAALSFEEIRARKWALVTKEKSNEQWDEMAVRERCGGGFFLPASLSVQDTIHLVGNKQRKNSCDSYCGVWALQRAQAGVSDNLWG